MSRFIWITLSLCICAAGALWGYIIFVSAPHGTELFFLPVGQGDAQLVRVGGINVLIDGGPNRGILSSLDTILGARGHIDIVFVSHGQTDHIQGLFDVVSSRPVGVLLYQGATTPLLEQLFVRAREYSVPVVQIKTGSTLLYKDALFEVLSFEPSIHKFDSSGINDDSLVLKFTTPGGCALFTADIGSDAERQLSSYYKNKLDCDVLKVAHHGSKTSSLPEFLRAVSPALSVIEVGKNSYGHPTPEVLTRLAGVGSRILRTDQDGIVRVLLQPDKLIISSLKM